MSVAQDQGTGNEEKARGATDESIDDSAGLRYNGPMSLSHLQGYKVLLQYNYRPGREMSYRRFMVNQWLPAMQALGLEPLEIFHTMWGDYPIRQIALYARDWETLQRALTSQEWALWWQRLEQYVTDLSFCVVPARPWFQFCE